MKLELTPEEARALLMVVLGANRGPRPEGMPSDPAMLSLEGKLLSVLPLKERELFEQLSTLLPPCQDTLH